MKKRLFSLLFCVSTALVAFGCQDTGTPDISARLEGFEVKATDVAEIGDYYTPEVPTVTYNGEHAYVSLKAEQSGKELFLNGDNALLVEKFDDVVLTYTVQEGGGRAEKQTVITVQDTTAPSISYNRMPEVVYRGERFDYASYIRVIDLSGSVTSSIAVADDQGNAIETQNGGFTLAEDSEATEVVFTVSATDGKQNTANKVITLPVFDLPQYTKPLDFASLDISKITPQYSGTTVEKTTQDDGAITAKISTQKAWPGGTDYLVAHVNFPMPISAFDAFDYVKVTARLESNCDISIYGPSVEIKAGDTAMKEIIYDMEKIRAGNTSMVRDEKLRFNIAILAGRKYNPTPETLDVNFYVYDIEFCIDQTKVRTISSDEPVDLSAFGIAASEVVGATFTPEGGTAKAITFATYCPQTKGTLTLSVKKEGYRTTTIVLPINPVMTPVENGNEKDNDVEFNWNE